MICLTGTDDMPHGYRWYALWAQMIFLTHSKDLPHGCWVSSGLLQIRPTGTEYFPLWVLNIVTDTEDRSCKVGLISDTRVLSTTGGRGGKLPPKRLSFPPQKKSFTENKLQLFQIKIFLTTILRNQWRLLMSRNAISANLEHYIFKLFGGAYPRPP